MTTTVWKDLGFYTEIPFDPNADVVDFTGSGVSAGQVFIDGDDHNNKGFGLFNNSGVLILHLPFPERFHSSNFIFDDGGVVIVGDNSSTRFDDDLNNTLAGSGGSDFLTGLGGSDSISAGGGNDVIWGHGGDQNAWFGNDTIDGGTGFDIYQLSPVDNDAVITGSLTTGIVIVGGSINTVHVSNIEGLISGNRNDSLDGSAGNDYLDGGGGNDILHGLAGADTLRGSDGDDLVDGGDGNDFLRGNGGRDTLNGGLGDDLIVAARGSDAVDGGAGTDEVRDWTGINASTYTNVERIVLQDSAIFNTQHIGASSNLIGNAGNNLFIGNSASTHFIGAMGNDTLSVGAGNDTFEGHGQLDQIDFNGFSGAVTVTFTSQGAGTISSATTGTDSFSGIEQVAGGTANDLLTGGAGNERLRGHEGNDTLNGGGGSADWATYFDSPNGIAVNIGADSISVDLDHNDTTPDDTLLGNRAFDGFDQSTLAGVQHYTDTLIDIENVLGGRGDDTIIGSDGDNVLQGYAGNDIFASGKGNDTIDGYRPGNDNDMRSLPPIADGNMNQVYYGFATQGIVADLGAHTVDKGVGNGTDTLFNIQSVIGSEFADSIVGGGDADHVFTGSLRTDPLEVLEGGDGDDTIDGGDTIVGHNDVLSWRDQTPEDGIVVNMGPGTLTFSHPAYAQITLAGGHALDGYGHTDTFFNIDGVWGTNNADLLVGGSGSQRYEPLSGNTPVDFEFFAGAGGDDTIDGGAGIDRVQYDVPGSSQAVSVNLNLDMASNDGFGNVDTLFNIEQVRGSNNFQGDTLVGNDGDNTFDGGAGNDIIDGGLGTDAVDYRRSQLGVSVNLQNGTAIDGWDSSSATPGLQPFTDTLFNIENAIGSDFSDTFVGRAGFDNIFDGRGITRVDPSYFYSQNGIGVYTDEINYSAAATQVVVNLGEDDLVVGGHTIVGGTALDQGNGATNGVDTLIDIERFLGGAGNDVFVGSDGSQNAQGLLTDQSETWRGNAGNDTINGGSNSWGDFDIADYGNSTIGIDVNLGAGTASDGFGGTDTLINIDGVNGGSGGDFIMGGSDSRSLSGGRFEVFSGGAGNDTIYGSQQDFFGGGNGSSSDFDMVNYQGTTGGVFANLSSHSVTMGGKTVNSFTVDATQDFQIVNGVNVSQGIDQVFGMDGVRGGQGNDTFVGGDNGPREVWEPNGGVDQINGDNGYDILSYRAAPQGVYVDLGHQFALDGWGNVDSFSGIEGVQGGDFNDTLIGGGIDDDDPSNWEEFEGRAGDDYIDGGDTVDLVRLDSVNNKLDAVAYRGAPTAVLVDMSQDTSTVNDGYGGTDTLVGIEIAIGSSYDDTLIGGNVHHDRIEGYEGRAGNDSIVGGSGNDYVFHDDSPYGVKVDLSLGRTLDDGWGVGTSDTLVGIENAVGSRHDDTLIGNSGDNELIGQDGSDMLRGGGGNDTLIGDNDNQQGSVNIADYSTNGVGESVTVNLTTGIANDGLGGTDLLSRIDGAEGGAGDDTLIGNDDANYFVGAAGNDLIDGRDGVDWVNYGSDPAGINANLATGVVQDGFGGVDQLVSIEGIVGSDFSDTLIGSNGDDRFDSGKGNDLIVGGAGFDRVRYSAADGPLTITGGATNGDFTVTGAFGTDTLSGIEAIVGGELNDSIHGSSVGAGQREFFGGGGGNDTIIGDTVGGGQTVLSFNNIDHGFFINIGADDTLTGSAKVDYQYFDASGTNYVHFSGIDGVVGGTLSDSLTGGSHNEFFQGNQGSDTIDGNGGVDTVSYSLSTDAVIVNLSGNTQTVNYLNLDGFRIGNANDSLGNDVVTLGGGQAFDGYNTDPDNNDIFNSTDFLSHIENVEGSDFADTMFGNGSNNRLSGGDGNDWFAAGGGNDVFIGGDGFDQVNFRNSTAAGVGVNVDLASGVANKGVNGADSLSGIEDVNGTDFNDTLKGSDVLPWSGLFRPGFFTSQENFTGRMGSDTIDGGGTANGQNDSVNYGPATAGVTVNLGTGVASDGQGGTDKLLNIDQVLGSNFADVLTGGSQSRDFGGGLFESFRGGIGADTIDGKDGQDRVEYQANASGPVIINLGTSAQVVANSAYGAVTIGGGRAIDGADSVFTPGQDSAVGGVQPSIDVLINIEQVRGTQFSDIMFGGGGAQNAGTIYDHETFEGLEGNDTINGLGGIDFASYQQSVGAVDVNLATGVGRDGYGTTDVLINIEGVVGSDFGDKLTGGDGDNIFRGGGGADTIDGGLGNNRALYNLSPGAVNVLLGDGTLAGSASDGYGNVDTLISINQVLGSVFNDTIMGAGGNDTLEGDAGNDVLDGAGGINTVSYTRATAGVTVDLGADTAFGGAGNDALANFTNVIGGAGNDLITGDANDNVFEGGAGNDTLAGGGGNDTLVYTNSASGVSVNLGAAAVVVGTGVGAVTLAGGHALDGYDRDTLTGGVQSSVDTFTSIEKFTGSNFVDTLYTDQNFSLQGSAGFDNLTLTGTGSIDGTGNALNNAIIGNVGNNVLDGGAGADTLTGGAGNDIYRLDSLGDVVVETVGGNDTIILTQSYLDAASIAVLAHPFSFDLNATGRTGIETVTVDDAAGVKITVVGNALANFLVGNLDANTLSGGAGNDTLDGNGGANSLIGGAGDDLFRVRNSLDIVKEDDNAGIDTVESFVASYKLTAGVDNLKLLDNGIAVIGRGNALNNRITGNSLDNSLFGDLGNDTLEGGAGNDKLFGGAGSDSYILSGNDQVIEVGGSAADQALIAVTADLSSNSQLEVLRSTNNSGIGITGGKASEDIIGGGGSDTLKGGAGTNTLEGGQGNDVYVLGGSGDTIVETGSGIDEVQADFSIDLAKLGSIENVTLLGTGNINALGNALANRIAGNDADNLLTGLGGSDTLAGAGGNDTLDGGAGDDTLDGGAGSDTVSYASATTAVTVSLVSNTATGGAGTDVLSNFENILGGAGADTLTGDGNDNVIDGGAGIDRMDGAAGNDTYVVSVAGETIIDSAGIDTVRTGLASYSLQNGLENLTETGTAAANLVGNTADNVITGGAGADTLAGGAGNDTLVGNAGNDTYVLEGADVIVEDSIGGGIDTVRTTENAPATLAENLENFILLATNGVNATGNTSNNNILVQGGTGNDTLDGGTGSDTLTGGAGNDTYLVDAQADTIVETATAAGGVDTVIASVSYSIAANAAIENLIASGSAVINLTGNAGNNHLTGNANANVLDGGAGNDTLAGGDGNDLYIVSTGDVINVDSDGTDLVRAASNWTLVGGLDNLELTGTAAIGVGNELDNRLTGTAAANTLDGGIGDDTLVGLEGNDSYIVDSLDDTIIDSAGVDTVLTALASYTLQTGLENLAAATGGPAASLTGNAANNVITGGTGSDTLSGLAGADTLNGGNGDDRLDGGAGIDSMVGGAGNDTYVVDVVGDAVNESTLVGGGIDTVIASINYTLGAGLENLVLAVGTANLAGTGNTLDNALTGNAGNNLLSGLAGSDTLSGGIGNDTIDGGAGNDTLDGGEGSSTLETDTVSYASATTAVNVDLAAGTASGTGTGTDTLLHFENVLGGAGADSITGNGNANLLDGGLGIDTMAGGDGNDTYMVNVAGDVVAETLDGGTADTVVSQVNYALGANVENLVLGGTAANGTGNELNNRITGNAAANTLMGAVGDDTLIGGAGADSLNGGVGGSDWASYEDSAASVIVNLNLTGTTVFGVAAHTGNVGGVLDVLTDIENARGGSGADTLVAAAGGSALDGGAGNDLLRGGAGNDILMGGDGNADWADFANLGAGNDVMADLGNSMAGGIGVGSDTLSGIENLRGGAGNDTLVGDDGNNILEGGLGSDSLVGGGGIDWAILGGTTAWIADLQDAHTAMTIGGQVDTLEGIENLLGGSGNDILTGNDDANWLDGAAGNDILTGGLGNDTYVVDVAGDRVIEDGDNVGIDTVRSAVSINLTVAGVVVSTSLDLIENVTLTGTAVASAIGNTLDNVLTGNSAANTLSGGIGSDTLDGGAGADSMAGGADDDTYYVDVAGDVVTESTLPGGGTDTVIVSTSVVNFSYTLGAGLENLTLLGSGSLAGTGNTQDNVLTGNAGANTLNGGAGADTLIGGNGNDVYGVDNSGDVVQETGNGIDRIESSVNVSLAASHPNWIGEDAIENVTLTGTASVAAIGNTLDNVLTGNAGANTLNGGAGNDTMIGGAGNDTYVVDSAGDVVNETLGGGGTADTVSASISYTLGAGLENLLLTLTGNIDGTGNELNNLITGNTWDNVLTGNAGADTLDGGGTLGGGGLTGEDTLIGGAGDDVYEIDSEGDVIVETVAAGTDRVRSMISFTLTDNLEQLELLDGGSALYGIGNAAANLILGNAAANSLDGGAGADTLTGGAGDDTLNGGAGIDSMTGGAGNDFYVVDVAGDVVNETIAGNSGFDTVDSQVSYSLGTNVEALILHEGAANLTGTGNTLDNVLTGNAGANTLLGGLGNDTLDGGAGNDSLDGGAGADTMIGGAGNDTFIFDNAGDSASEENGGGTDTVVSSVTATLADNVENLTLSGTAALLGTGNTLDNVLTGNSGANTLSGGDGDDTLIGGAGNDKLRGGDGDDTFVYDAADVAPDAVIGGAGQDTMLVTDKTGVTIDLTSVASAGRYDGIEHWDISGPANVNNTLNLSVEGVHTMLGSDIGTLVVDGNYNDVVNAVGQGWEVVQVIAPDHPEDPGATYYYLYNYNNAGLDLSLQLDYDMTLNVS